MGKPPKDKSSASGRKKQLITSYRRNGRQHSTRSVQNVILFVSSNQVVMENSKLCWIQHFIRYLKRKDWSKRYREKFSKGTIIVIFSLKSQSIGCDRFPNSSYKSPTRRKTAFTRISSFSRGQSRTGPFPPARPKYFPLPVHIIIVESI